MGYPSIFPTGTTIYQKEKTYNGYTIFPSAKGALLIDMNGNEVQLWAGLGGFPNKILPGGYVMGTTGTRGGKYAYQDQTDLVQVDWDGNIVWKFDHTELVADPGKEPVYMARQHHDYQREGSTVGYYYPGGEPKTDSGNTLILTHENLYNHEISDKRLIDDKIIEVDWDGNILWSWRASDHFHSLVLMRRQKTHFTGIRDCMGKQAVTGCTSIILQRWEKTNGMTAGMRDSIRIILFLMREIPTYLELFQRKQEISSGGSVRISMKMRRQENLAGSLDSIIYI